MAVFPGQYFPGNTAPGNTPKSGNTGKYWEIQNISFIFLFYIMFDCCFDLAINIFNGSTIISIYETNIICKSCLKQVAHPH